MSILFSLLAGIIFGAGLTLSDMVNPARVLNFLDVVGTWDPTLMFVMAGGLAVTTLGYSGCFAAARLWPTTNSTCRPGDRSTCRWSAVRRCLGWGGVSPASARSGLYRSCDVGAESAAVCCSHADRDDFSEYLARQAVRDESAAAIVETNSDLTIHQTPHYQSVRARRVTQSSACVHRNDLNAT